MNIFLTDLEYTTLAKATETFGQMAMKGILVEEMAELMVALSHYERGRCSVEEVIEETADSFVALAQLAQALGFDRVMQVANSKLKRLGHRVEANDKNLNTLSPS